MLCKNVFAQGVKSKMLWICLGSPLDYLPNIAPSSLPMAPRADNQQIR